MTALALYVPPPAIARAWFERGYPSLQIDAHAEDVARKARMCESTPIPSARPKEPPPAPAPAPAPARCSTRDLIDLIDQEPPRVRTTSLIVKTEVANEFGLSVRELLSHARVKAIVEPRMIAMWLHSETHPFSTRPSIGRSFADVDTGRRRDHTTVINACRMVESKLAADPAYRERVMRLWATIDEAVEANALLAEAADAHRLEIKTAGIQPQEHERLSRPDLLDRMPTRSGTPAKERK